MEFKKFKEFKTLAPDATFALNSLDSRNYLNSQK